MYTSSALAYLSLYILAFILIYAIDRDKQIPKVPLFSLFILLTLFSGVRFNVGMDQPMYQIIYEQPFTQHKEHLEPLWLLLHQGLRMFGAPFLVWGLLTSAVIIGLMLSAYRRQSYWLAATLFIMVVDYKLYFEPMNIVRQYVAVALGLFALPLWREKRYWAFLALCLVAMQIHSSAIVLLVFIPLVFIRFPRWFLSLAAIVGLVAMPSLLDYMRTTLASMISNEGISYYLLHPDTLNRNAGSGSSFYVFTLFALYFIWRTPDLVKRDKNLLPYINLFVLSMMLTCSFRMWEAAHRIFFFAYAFSPIMLTNVWVKGKLIDRLACAAFVVLTVILTVNLIASPQNTISDYEIILQPHDLPRRYPLPETL